MRHASLKIKLRKIADSFNVKVNFDDSYDGGRAYNAEDRVVVGTSTSKRKILSTFFHEICHILMTRERMYPNYHYIRKSKLNKRKLRREALRAEKAADGFGSSLMRIYFPTYKFYHFYDKKWAQEWHKNWLNHHYPLRRS